MSAITQHIVFLSPGFAQNEQDTTTIPAIQIYLKVLKQLHPELKITIIAFQFPFTTEKYKWFGCEVIPLNGRNLKSKKIYIWRKAYHILKKINAELPINVVHSFWLRECAFIGHLYSKQYKIKHICTLMGQDVLKNNYYLKILPILKMKLIAVSTFQQNELNKTFNLSTEIIPWGINRADFSNVVPKTIDIIGVGSLIPLKNFEFFIEIVFEIHKIIPVQVMIIGDGIQKEFLQEKINTLQLENTIHITGLLPYQTTIDKISQAKVLLHTSKYESFGMVFAEALQVKTKIVSREVGCAFTSENWSVCNSKKEFINACIHAIATSFSSTVENPFLIENTIKNYLNIYNE